MNIHFSAEATRRPRNGLMGTRAAALAAAAIFTASFHYVFLTFLSVNWQYWGFVHRNDSIEAAVVSYVLTVTPAWWLPRSIERASVSILWSLYALVYVPSIVCVALVSSMLTAAAPLLLALFVGMSILAAGHRVPLWRVPRAKRVSFGLFLVAAWSSAAFLMASTLYVYWGALSWPSFEAIYEVRLAARRIQEGSPFVNYATQWLSRGILPLLVVMGLHRKHYGEVAVAGGAYAVLFMTSAHKVYFVVPVVVAGVYLLVRLAPAKFGTTFLVSLTGLIVAVMWFVAPIRDLLLMRALGWSGLATYLYDDFIGSHPVTYWSHVKGFNWFIDYPFAESLPFVIGYEYWGNPELTSNAHFWAMDGVAAAGGAGVIVISVACGAVLWLLDSVSRDLDRRLVVPWVAAYATSLADAGLFTALLSGGLGFVIVAMVYVPRSLLASAANKAPLDTSG